MAQVLQPWQLFVSVLAGWINEHQQAAIEYLREENRVLREQLGGKRLRLTDDQRRRLAAKGKKLGRRVLGEIASIVTAWRYWWSCRRSAPECTFQTCSSDRVPATSVRPSGENASDWICLSLDSGPPGSVTLYKRMGWLATTSQV